MSFRFSRRAVLRAVATLLYAPIVLPASAQSGARYSSRPEVAQYIDDVVAQHGFERAQLVRWLDAARYSPTVERLMQPPIPFAQRNWFEYRDRYLDPARIDGGTAFWRAHAATLARARAQFGVPPEYIVAILGIETQYGRITGNFRTIDALMTLTFDYTRRADYYRGELTELLLLAREQKVNPLDFKGSFAGALGLPQFMPGSIRKWAVDFDGNGRIDLTASPADAIGSVANFLVAHGWQADLPVVADAEASEAIVDALGRGIAAQTPWSSALAEGVVADLSVPLDTPVILIDLPIIDAAGQPDRQYRIGTANFAAILHYNRSYFYATAVTEVAAALLARQGTPSHAEPSR